ncbi:MAG: hypothetical protein VYE68_05695 [Acidobacteriota bacterium]|nr:hypothetical protein [Acidobacteriota bacterium]
MMRAGAEIYRRSRACPSPQTRIRAAAAAIQRLDWDLSAVPWVQVQKELADLLEPQPATCELANLGQRALDERGLRPVELFVLALQLTVFRLTGQLASMSQFISTPEMTQFHEAFCGCVEEDGLWVRFEAAVMSQQTACRRARSQVALPTALALFRSWHAGSRGRYVNAVFRCLARLVRALGLDDEGQGRDIVMSHPAVVPGVEMVGRPGVRLPYVRLFGVHYQVLERGARLTLMPGREWTIPNQALVTELGVTADLLLERLAGRP